MSFPDYVVTDPSKTIADTTRRAQALREGGHSQRCHTLPTIGDASVGKHSFNMLTLLYVLWPDAPIRLWRAVLLHDVAERWVGDTPADAKYGISKALGKAVREAEAQVELDLGIHGAISNLPPEEASWLKGLDMLEFQMFSEDQLAVGNRNYQQALINVRAMMQSEWVPEPLKRFSRDYVWTRTRGMVQGELEVLGGLDKGQR